MNQQNNDKNNSIEDYLTGPRKKKRDFIIIAANSNKANDIATNALDFCKKFYPSHIVNHVTSTDELSKRFNKNISILIMEDTFDDIEILMTLVKALKKRRKDQVIPVLFITEHRNQLVDNYHKYLYLYHETDDYIEFNEKSLNEFFTKIKTGIDEKFRRRSKRYNVNINAEFYDLNSDETHTAKLKELSIHGAILQAPKNVIFKLGDQLKVNIPIRGDCDHKFGDFIKLTAKIRRVLIAGNEGAISFEYVTDIQYDQINKLLTSMVFPVLKRKSKVIKDRPLSEYRRKI